MNDLMNLVDNHIEDVTEDKRNKITDNDLKSAKLIEVDPL
jgi:hypothetical protein